MDIRLSLYEDARSFMETAADMLYARETINNLILGVSERLLKNPSAYEEPFFATVSDETGDPFLAALMTSSRNLMLAGRNQFEVGVTPLISYLQEKQISPPGVIGPDHIVDKFTETWTRLAQEFGRLQMRQRVYELRSVNMPPLPDGHFRIATLDDSPRIADFLQAFSDEELGEEIAICHERAQELIAKERVFVWEVDGEVVSMAMKARPIAHSISINGVYTPPDYRCQGFATALVARLSQHLLNSGYKFINLSTDLENPSTNSIYQIIGYHPVCDYHKHSFKQSLPTRTPLRSQKISD